MKLERKIINFEVKEIGESGQYAYVSGIANKVDVIDQGYDLTIQGAFDKSIATKPKVPALNDHDMHKIIGINTLGINLNGDLITELELNLDVQIAKERLSLIKQFQNSNMPMGLSIGYYVKDYDFTEAGIRILKEVEVVEVSVVAFPMNQDSVITGVKSLENELLESKNEIARLKKANEIRERIGKIINE